MKNCADIDRLMTPYVDGEVGAADRQAIEAHLAVCPPCCAHADAARAARRIVRSQASTLTQAAPAALRARCVGAAPVPGTAARPTGVGLWVRRWVPLSVAATVLLAAEYGLEMVVPASAEGEQLDLVDVRFCDYEGGSMAHLLYEVEGQPVSFFVIPGVHHAERSLEVMGLAARLWSNDASTCVFVGHEDAARMDKLATYMRGYER